MACDELNLTLETRTKCSGTQVKNTFFSLSAAQRLLIPQYSGIGVPKDEKNELPIARLRINMGMLSWPWSDRL